MTKPKPKSKLRKNQNERKQKERDAKRALGLVPLELWTKERFKQKLKDMNDKLLKS